MIRSIHSLSAGLLAVLALGASPALAAIVPMVGCPTDGQIGPEAAPENGTKNLRIDAKAAAKLAYYSNKEIGVLGPRGWHCLVLAGSNGTSIYVTPERLNPNAMLRGPLHTFSGDAIQLSVSLGETSGRFEAAKIMARVFPQNRRFVEQVIAEKLDPASEYVFGPYPSDHMKRLSEAMVEYETPAGMKGLGTHSRLIANNSPILGMAFLGEDDSVLLLSARVSDPALTAAIIRQTEMDRGAP